jgi:hypothetical protein
MGRFTYYLILTEEAPAQFKVKIESDVPLVTLHSAMESQADVRYSPILPAYLVPNETPPSPPSTPNTIAFLFAARPYQALGRLKPDLTLAEIEATFFTEGLASIIILNCGLERALALKALIGCSTVEFWSVRDGRLETPSVHSDPQPRTENVPPALEATRDDVLDVYIEQISASVTTLWTSYGVYFPEERPTLIRILQLTKDLIARHIELSKDKASIVKLRQSNAIISALVEISASLSYSVTQGTSGAVPIVSNRSPFPHHSLLGIGGEIRALTKFVRYVESAFKRRSAASIIDKQYSTKNVPVPHSIAKYESGPEYAFAPSVAEEFDCGGEFRDDEDVPLLVQFSLRHGFKESKFSITAASESLTAESLPAWTLMTLSHEMMHSRVRDIFQALFGTTWEDDDSPSQWDGFYQHFNQWYRDEQGSAVALAAGIRNAVMNFCLAMEREAAVGKVSRSDSERQVSRAEFLNAYLKHKRLATEIFVHFHDFYFAYAAQSKLYVMSLWASWTTVAAPVARPLEYLARTLATISSGTGTAPRAAFEGAAEILEEALDSLESVGFKSALFAEVRRLLKEPDRERCFARFKPAYYLIDQVRRYFASRSVASAIDRLETDPFADGSTIATEYAASVYVFGDVGKVVSPIRYSLNALVRQLSGEPAIGDLQWLTAWNSMVISSAGDESSVDT